MKHLIHKKHHPHLKKRAFLELGGLGLLLLLLFSQRTVITEAIATVSRVEVIWFIVLLGLFWFLLPLTAYSYRLISPKPKNLKITTTTIAHLAGSGPGRIIPGGIGNLTIGAMHLKKTGLTIEQSVAVVATNNIFGMLVMVSLVLGTLLIRPESISIITNSISANQLIIGGIFGVAMIVLAQWLFHARGTHREIIKTLRQWRLILSLFFSNPIRVIQVIVVALCVALLHTLLLHFSAFALNIDLAFTDALIALSFGVALGGIFPTPGGVGGVETGITGVLIVLGYDATSATSIAVLYRVATYWQPLIPGTLAYLYLRERKLL